METIEKFIGVEFSEKLRQAIQKQQENQKDYKREHKVRSVSNFGVSKEQIARDFDFVFHAQNRSGS